MAARLLGGALRDNPSHQTKRPPPARQAHPQTRMQGERLPYQDPAGTTAAQRGAAWDVLSWRLFDWMNEFSWSMRFMERQLVAETIVGKLEAI
jgi:hypothetical protein